MLNQKLKKLTKDAVIVQLIFVFLVFLISISVLVEISLFANEIVTFCQIYKIIEV